VNALSFIPALSQSNEKSTRAMLEICTATLRFRCNHRMALRYDDGERAVLAPEEEAPMNANVDIYVCRPNLGVNKILSGVFIQFEVMDKTTLQGTGKPHTVAMTTSDAMRLLALLENAQQRLSLPKEKISPAMVEISSERNN
jgi:hypothetical protein